MKNTTSGTLDQREADHAIKNYSRIPNMLVDGYPELLPQDKWLFVCLVRLCGKEGTRYLSLRYIAERTGFSPSVLSDNKKSNKPGMLKRLHNAGIIHAEIKYRKGINGKETSHAQYHITIADTWRLNYDFYSKEQDCSDSEQSMQDSHETVLNQNATVLKQNRNCDNCSESERNCSDSGAIVRLQNKITESNKITERKKAEPRQQKTNASDQQESFSHSSTHSEKTGEKKASLSSEPKQEEKVMLTQEEQRVYDQACEQLFQAESPEITIAMKGHCAKLAKHIKNKEQMTSLIAFTRKEQHLDGKTVYFGNLARGLNGWLQTQHQPTEVTIANMTTTTPTQSTQPITDLRVLYQMQQAKRQAAMQQEEAEKQAAQAERSATSWAN